MTSSRKSLAAVSVKYDLFFSNIWRSTSVKTVLSDDRFLASNSGLELWDRQRSPFGILKTCGTTRWTKLIWSSLLQCPWCVCAFFNQFHEPLVIFKTSVTVIQRVVKNLNETVICATLLKFLDEMMNKFQCSNVSLAVTKNYVRSRRIFEKTDLSTYVGKINGCVVQFLH